MTHTIKPLHSTFALIGAFALLATLLQLFHNQAQALDYTVTNTNDSGVGSLRAAIDNAFANPGADTIIFDAALDGETIVLSSGALIVASEVSIDASNLPNKITIDGNDTYRIIQITDGSVVTLSHLILINGTTLFGSGPCETLCGGAIYAGYDTQVMVSDSIIDGNNGNSGGGIYTWGYMVISGTVVSNNQSVYDGGGIRNDGHLTVTHSTIINNSALTPPYAIGGGIYSGAAFLTVDRSTIAYNTAANSGGGLYLSAQFSNSTVSIVNSTLSYNIATDNGGAIFNIIDNMGTQWLTMTHATLSGNTAVSGGGIYQTTGVSSTAITLIQNSIIVASAGGNCVGVGGDAHNLADDTTCTGFMQGDARLAPLADNGGSTQTHALLLNSTAVSLANPTICQSAPVNSIDQRGFPRTAVCDSGAFEAAPFQMVYLPMVIRN